MSKKKPYDSSDPQQVSHASAKAELDRLQELEDIKDLMDSPPGVRFFRRLFIDGHIMSTSFAGNAPRTYFLEGERNLALRYIQDLEAAVPDFMVRFQLIKNGEENE